MSKKFNPLIFLGIDDSGSSGAGVTSVNGQTGVVVLDTDNISEGATNKYFTDERAEDAVGGILTDTSTIDLTYNDAGNTITADILANSITNSLISPTAAIDASKIADGSVSNSEFQFINSVTSNVQTQLNNKLTSSLTNAHVFVGNGSNIATDVPVSGDATLANTGALTVNYTQPEIRYINFDFGNDSTGDGSDVKPWKTVAHMYASITDATPTKIYTVYISGVTNTDSSLINGKPNINLTADSYVKILEPIIISGASSGNDSIEFTNIFLDQDFQWTRNDSSIFSLILINTYFNGSCTFQQLDTTNGFNYIYARNTTFTHNVNFSIANGQGSFYSCVMGGHTTTFADDLGLSFYEFYSGYVGSTLVFNGGTFVYFSGIEFDETFGAALTINTTGSGTATIQTDSSGIPSVVTGTPTLILTSLSKYVSYPPTTSSDWNTVPTTTRGGLDTLATSGVVKSQTQNLVLASPNGSSGLPSFRALVAGDLPSTSLTSAHIFVGNGSNIATNVAVSGDLTLINTGAFSVIGANDTLFNIYDNIDATKKFKWDLSGQSTGVTNTLKSLSTQSQTYQIQPNVDATANILTQNTTSGQVFIGANSTIGGANSGIQYSDATTANRGQIKLHSYFNGTSVAGVSTLTSRSGTVGTNAAVVAGQDYSKWTAQAGATTAGSAPISGTFAFKANTVNSLTVTSDYHIALTNLAGTLGDRLYLGSEGALQLPNYTTGIAHFDGTGNITSSAISLTADVSGTLPVSNGGTGLATLTVHDVLVGNGTSTVSLISPSTAGFVLTSNGVGADPSFQSPASVSPSSITLTSAHILVGNGSNVAADVAMSGDATIANTGALTVVTVGTSSAANIHSAELAANAATSSNTTSTIVKRDGSGNAQVSDPLVAQDIATKNYVDNKVNGLDWKEECAYATTSPLASNIYNNGASGVGATLTGVSVGALTIDGSTPSIGDRVLIKNEVTSANNGIYVVTTVGSVVAVYVLTRTADFDQAADIEKGDTTLITSGSTLSFTSWSLTSSSPFTIGTTALNFSQVSGPGSIIAGNGISVSGNTVSLITPVTNVNGGTGLNTSSASNGTLLIGNGSGFNLSTLTAGSGITITNGSGTITIAETIPNSTGDIAQTSFTALDNQSSAQNVTGFSFSAKGFRALVNIQRSSTYATYNILGTNKSGSWTMSQDFDGDITGITFTITNAGQVQYTSTSTGSNATVNFRAQVLA